MSAGELPAAIRLRLSVLAGELREAAKIDELPARSLEAAAIIEEALDLVDIQPVVVGGLSVALWTAGDYVTPDIDAVMPTSERGFRVLEELGLKRRGRTWILPDTKIEFEAPGWSLAPAEEARLVELESGRTLRVISPEDALVWRLREVTYWQGTDVVHQALYLLRAPALDRRRAFARADEEGLGGVLREVEEIGREIDAGREFASYELRERLEELSRRYRTGGRHDA